MNANFAQRWSAVALATSAGLALAVQPATQPATRTAQPGVPVRQTAQSLDFAKLAAVNGADIANTSGDVVGEISDLIISRGTGRVEYAVITSGAILGLGGKSISLPFNALRWDPTNERFVSDLTEAQIEHAASFTPENWSDLEHTTWTEGLENWWDDTFGDADDAVDAGGDDDDADTHAGADTHSDPYSTAVAAAQAEAGTPPTLIDGTVVRVLRDDSHEEQVILVEVRRNGASGAIATERVVLGPSWFVLGQPTVPMRGDPIQIKAVPFPGEGQNRWIAVSGTIDGAEVNFRDDEGWGAWADRRDHNDRDDSSEAEASPQSRRGGRLMFASSLVGAEARASDEEGGEVQNVIVERMSGHVAFIGFDPNENILGWGDEIILVPWDLVSVNADHKVRIDATRDMLLASEPIPEDIKTLTTAPMPGSIYNAYRVDAPVYRPRWHVQQPGASINAAPGGDPWATEGAITRAFRDGPAANISGRIVQVTKVALVPGGPEATILHLQCEDGAKQVVVGPSSAIDRLGVTFQPEQTVTVRGTSASINNKPYVGARTIVVNGRTIELWNRERTAWIPD